MAEQLFQVGVKALVRDQQGRILLVRETSHKVIYWDLPGGRMDEGKDLIQTLSRELKEEIGVQDFSSPRHVATLLSNKRVVEERGEFALLLVVYSAVIAEREQIQPSEPGLEVRWFTTAEASKELSAKYPVHFCKVVEELP